MTQFQKAIQSPVKCDICGELMHPMYGGGWDFDRIVCAARECGAEVVFPTSTEVQNATNKERTYCLICRREMPTESGQVCAECADKTQGE